MKTTKKLRLLVDVSVVISIDEDKLECKDALLKAIASGDITEVIAPYQLMDERYDNDEVGDGLQWNINIPMDTLQATETLIAELNKRGFKVIKNNKVDGETYLVTIDHVDGPCTQLCDTEANAKAFVFGHILSYETFEEFDAALKGSIDAVDGIIDYSIVKQKLNEVKIPEGDDEDVDKEYEVTVYFFDMDTDPTTAYGEENYAITAPNEAEAKTEAIQKAYAESDHADENINFSTDAVIN